MTLQYYFPVFPGVVPLDQGRATMPAIEPEAAGSAADPTTQSSTSYIDDTTEEIPFSDDNVLDDDADTEFNTLNNLIDNLIESENVTQPLVIGNGTDVNDTTQSTLMPTTAPIWTIPRVSLTTARSASNDSLVTSTSGEVSNVTSNETNTIDVTTAALVMNNVTLTTTTENEMLTHSTLKVTTKISPVTSNNTNTSTASTQDSTVQTSTGMLKTNIA